MRKRSRITARRRIDHSSMRRKLRELAARQARLNAALDLDKSDKRAAQVEDAEVVAARPWQERVARIRPPGF